MDRPLKRPADFQYAIGKEVELGLYKAQNGKKKYVGILQSYEEEKNSITLNVKGREIPFDLKDVTRVRPTIQF